MLLIDCPWCGEREESEFTCGGEAHLTRPADSEHVSDEVWGEYVFMRKNPKGMHHELWRHSEGCARYFNMARNTVTHEIAGVYRIGETPPETER